jgi:ribosomal-protein-alanine N-acetyltransferase
LNFQDAFTSFPELESVRLVMRQVETDDAASLYEHFATLQGDRFWDLQHRSVENARQHIDLVHTWYQEQRLLWWAITLKGERAVIGSCSLYEFERESRAEIGYWLSTNKQGLGIATEAVRRVVRFGFAGLNLHRIQASCHPQNHAAAAVVKRAGFREEGLLREYEPGRSGWRDCLMFSLLKREADDS